MKQFINFSILLILGAFLMNSIAQSQPVENKNAKTNNPKYKITVTQGKVKLGEIVLELFPDVAPKHCRNFDSLVTAKFYNGLAFHRIVPGFVIQGGDPNTRNKPEETWGEGDSTQTTVPAEFSKLSHKRGILSAARRGDDINSATSQFFICLKDVARLDGQYSIYGQVVSGMDVVDKIAAVKCDGQRPIEKVVMNIEKMKNTHEKSKTEPVKK